MPDSKLSALTETTNPALTDLVLLTTDPSTSPASKKCTLTNIKALVTGAPTDAQYITLAANGSLSAERVLTAGTGISVTDGTTTATVALASGELRESVLYEGTLGTAGQFDVSSISQAYTHLKLIIVAQSTVEASSDWMYIYFNNDTTVGNYRFTHYYTGSGGSGNENGNYPRIAISGASSSSFAYLEIIIPNYTVTTYNKAALLRSGIYTSSYYSYYGHITRVNTEAINRITLTTDNYSTDKLSIGSYLMIIGSVKI